MGSINAQLVAMKVSEKARKGEKISVSQIMRDVGYSKHTARNVKASHTNAFKIALELEKKPLLERLELQIKKFQSAMEQKELNGEDTRVIASSLDIYIKNYQLLSGGATERQVFVLPSQAMKRYEIDESKPDTLPKDGSIEPLN